MIPNSLFLIYTGPVITGYDFSINLKISSLISDKSKVEVTSGLYFKLGVEDSDVSKVKTTCRSVAVAA